VTKNGFQPGIQPVILLLPVILSACVVFKTTPITRDIALADLDGDGDLDAFFANGQTESRQPNSVWINLGGGEFMDSGQALGIADTWSIVLGDLDGDGDLDAFEGGWGFLYINNGHGRFTTEDRAIPMAQGSYTRYAALGDLDQDGDLDLTLAGCCGAFSGHENDPWVIMPASTIYTNDGSGRFENAGSLTDQGCQAAALGDLDGDGSLDAFFACWTVIEHPGVISDVDGLFDKSVQLYSGPYTEHNRAPNRVFLNDGSGQLLDSGQALGDAASYAVALGDLDGDGDLDAFIGNLDEDELWINQGGAQGGVPGQFIVSSQLIPNRATNKVDLGDVDGDGDLDALLNISARRGMQPELWLNDGNAQFTPSGQRLQIPKMQVYTLGDIDNDGDLDIFAGSYDNGYGVRRNDGSGNFE
jgi:hypothetical protein